MELLLWRHCEAEPGEPDLGRALTGKGEKQARRMAAWLHAHLPDSARILASPARRSQQTAQALAELAPRRLKTVDALAPARASRTCCARCAGPMRSRWWWWSATSPPRLGCQPPAGGVEADWPIRKGGVWWFSSRDRDGVEQVVLRAAMNPELL